MLFPEFLVPDSHSLLKNGLCRKGTKKKYGKQKKVYQGEMV